MSSCSWNTVQELQYKVLKYTKDFFVKNATSEVDYIHNLMIISSIS